ncbi:MAG: Asp23/Gls24 family envelope stress response protein [Coriobacteriia bacterium]|nr:Asp23/Gls24 family envelope stress response protein [Coriobacteriia bacterium]
MADVTEGKKGVSGGFVLETDRGITTISDAVVAKIASIATREVNGVQDLGKQFRRLVGKISPGETLTQGVNVEVGKKEAAVDLVILVEYGYSIPALAQEVRDNVVSRVEEMTGLIVKEVNIEVDDLWIPTDEQPAESRVA